MNTNFYQSFVTPAGHSAKYTRFGKASKAKLPTAFYGFAALLVGIFVTVSPTKAQSVTPATYINDLYTWWRTGNDFLTYKKIYVRATFVGGSAHPAQVGGIPSMAIFQGKIVGAGNGSNGFGDFGPGLTGPIAKGTGTFYNVGDLDYSPFSAPSTVPFLLYSSSDKLVLWIDLSSVWSNAKNLSFLFDKITSPYGWPWGNWTGLNGGVGSACGEVTLACSVDKYEQPH